jgi:hypothetical protein
MKIKILALATIFSCSLIEVNAQTPAFQKGDKVFNLGLGLSGYSPSGYYVTIPSASASFEVGIMDIGHNKGSLGIGGYIGYASYNENGNFSGNNYWSVSRVLIGARGAFHYPFVDKLDTYGGFTLGIMARSWKWNGSVNQTDHPSRNPFGGDMFVGARYYFSDKFAAMGELALGSYLTLGISLKL